MGANWETFDCICECGYATNAYGNYVTNMTKRVEALEALLRKNNINITV